MKISVTGSQFPGRRPLVLIVLLLMLASQVLAAVGVAGSRQRNLQFDHLTTDSNLSQDMINDIVQDRRGYVWIATQEGLNRFDGQQVVHYENLRDDPHSLSDDFARTLLIDSEGVLWVGTKRGLDRYDESIDGFRRQTYSPADGASFAGEEVRALMQTHDGALWIGTQRRGLLRVDASGTVQRFLNAAEDPASLPDNSVLALLEDSIGNVWIGTENAGLSRYDPVTNRFVSYHHSAEKAQVVPGNEVRTIFEDRAGMLWIGTADAGLTRFDVKRTKIEHFAHDHADPTSLPDDFIRDVVEDSRGTLWIATGRGLVEWRGAEGFVTYVHSPYDPRSLINDEINKLYTDASGVLWIGTWDGVSRWNYFSDTFTYYRFEDGSLSGNTVTSLAESSDGVLWVAAYGTGLNRIDPVSGDVRIYKSSPQDETSIPSDELMVVHVDPQDRVWVGTRGHGIARLSVDESGFERYAHDPGQPDSLSGNRISSLTTDGHGNLWVGTFGSGLNRMAAQQPGRFERFRHDGEDPTSLSGDRVLRLYSDRGGSLWIGTDRAGLNRFDAAAGRFERFQTFTVADAKASADAAAEPEAIVLDTAMDLLEDRDGSLWIATLGQGLWRWNANDRLEGKALVDVFGKAEGLPSDTVYGVLEEGIGALWLSSNRGLTRFDLKGGIRQFDNRNGLRDREFMQGSRLRSASGKLMFGGISGLVTFYPGDLPVNTVPPRVVVQARSRQERLAASASGDPSPQISVDYLDRFLAFDFVALDFTSPDKNQYRYQLEGFDDHWIEGDGFRRATYTNLMPGRYTFKVQAANNDGLWNREHAGVDVRVIPAPWNTWWAYLAYSIVAAMLLGMYVRSQRGKLALEAQQREVLEEKVTARTQELAHRNRQLQSLNEALAEASVTDSLTGLNNRRYLDQFVNGSDASLARRLGALQGAPGEVPRAQIVFFMMIDLDDFKLVNDRFGHQAGDSVLLQVKDVLEASSRESDVLIRWGGDEFLIIGIATSVAAAKLLAERIRAAIADLLYDAGNGAVGLVSASIGIATFTLGEDGRCAAGWEQIVGIADRAAYISKTNGRNAWVSLGGAEGLTDDELDDFSDSLELFVEQGKIVVDSSLRNPPVLSNLQREVARRESASGPR